VVEIDPLKINVAAVAEVMSRAFAERHRILAVEVDDDEVVIASAEPYQRAWQENLEHVVRKRIRRVLADPRDIMRYTAEFYTMAGSVRGARAAGAGAGRPDRQPRADAGTRLHDREPDANDQHIVSIVDWLLQYAFEQRASDIHIEPRREIGRALSYRRRAEHGVRAAGQVCAAVTSRIKILGRMDVAEKRRPQDGRLKTRSPGGAEVELRLSTLPTAFGEKLVMRIFDPELLNKSFEDLGLADDDLARWQPHDRHGQRHRAGHRAHGLRQDHHPVFHAAPAGDARGERLHDRGPDRDGGGAFNQMQVNHASTWISPPACAR
jgi:general secretion pathway protein E